MSDKLTTNKETEIPAYNPDFLLADLQQYKRKLQKTFRVILDGKLVELFNKSNNGGPDQI